MIKRTLLAFGALLLLALVLLPSSRAFAASPPPRASAASSQAITPLINFSFTCSALKIDQTGILRAKCTRKNGSQNSTALALDPFIGNINGKLVANSNHFEQTCHSLGLAGATLTAHCYLTNGDSTGASCNLDNNIDNTNGVLVWVRGHSC